MLNCTFSSLTVCHYDSGPYIFLGYLAPCIFIVANSIISFNVRQIFQRSTVRNNYSTHIELIKLLPPMHLCLNMIQWFLCHLLVLSSFIWLFFLTTRSFTTKVRPEVLCAQSNNFSLLIIEKLDGRWMEAQNFNIEKNRRIKCSKNNHKNQNRTWPIVEELKV